MHLLRYVSVLVIMLQASSVQAHTTDKVKALYNISTLYQVPVVADTHVRVTYTAAKKPTRKVVIFCPGRGSYFEKNAGLIMALTGHDFTASHGEVIKNQVDFWCLDPRGQGGSGGRLTDDSGQPSQRGYIKTFDDYVQDIHKVITTKILPSYEGMEVEFYLMGASMGGHIILRYLQTYKDTLPVPFKRALAIVPMIRMNTAPWPEWVAKILVKTTTALGFGTSYTIGYGPVKLSNPDFSKFKGHHNRAEFDSTNQIMRDNMSLVTGGPTNQWVSAAFASQALLYTKAWPADVPVTFFIAGQDKAVNSAAALDFAQARGFQSLIYEKSAHNILKETKDYSWSFWQDLDRSLQ